jgi:hypothetical protein
VLVTPAAGGAIDFLSLVNNELGVFNANNAALNVNGVTGSYIVNVSLIGDHVFSYLGGNPSLVLFKGR